MGAAPLLLLRPKAPEFSEEVLEKQRLKDELAAQLDQLKIEVEKLEAEVRGEGTSNEMILDVEEAEKDLMYVDPPVMASICSLCTAPS